jgi:hypothetical protein
MHDGSHLPKIDPSKLRGGGTATTKDIWIYGTTSIPLRFNLMFSRRCWSDVLPRRAAVGHMACPRPPRLVLIRGLSRVRVAVELDT